MEGNRVTLRPCRGHQSRVQGPGPRPRRVSVSPSASAHPLHRYCTQDVPICIYTRPDLGALRALGLGLRWA